MYEKIEHIIIISVAVSLCYIVYREIRVFVEGYSNFKKSKANNEKYSIVHLICSIDFFRSLIFGCDSVLGILVTKMLLENLGIEYDGLILSIPLTLTGIGSILSQPAFQLLSYKTTIKNIYYISFAGLFISLAMLVFSIEVNGFIIYCIGKFIFGFAIILFLTSNHTVPMCINDEKLSFKTFRGFSMTDISGSILAIVICGELSYYFGWKCIYICAFVIAIIPCILIWIFLRKDICFSSRDENDISQIKHSFKALLALPMFACLFASFISYTTGMYKGFVFPLICQDFGYSTTSISYLTSLSLIVVYLFSRIYDKFTSKIEHWHLTWVCLAFNTVIFLVFIFNQSMLWSCLVLVLSGILYKSLFVELRVIAPRFYRKKNVDPAKVQPIFDFIDSISCTLRNPILGSFMWLGAVGPCLGLGALSSLGLIFFILFTFKSPLKNENKC